MRGGQKGGMRGGAVNLLTFHGRKWLRKRPQGAEVSLKDELSLTHTCSFPHTLSPSACFVSLSLSHTCCCPVTLHPHFFTFALLLSSLPPRAETPAAPAWRRLHIPEGLAAGTLGGVALLPKVPSSFVFVISEGTNVRLPGKREMDHPPSVCV